MRLDQLASSFLTANPNQVNDSLRDLIMSNNGLAPLIFWLIQQMVSVYIQILLFLILNLLI